MTDVVPKKFLAYRSTVRTPKDLSAKAKSLVISVYAKYNIIELKTQYMLSAGGLLQLHMDTPVDMLCFELLAMERKFDAVFSIGINTAIALGRTNLTVDALERHFGIPFLVASAEHAVTFTNKSAFAGWMYQNGLGTFTPTVYNWATWNFYEI